MCYAVLVRISPGYPTAMGRLHTCYSPVRRSPAVKSKLSTPLPLDLHVLSLSLAFILSQDQTLLCCYFVFSFFFSKKGDNYFLYCYQNKAPNFLIPGRLMLDLL